ncbi:MAG TPA: bifunctional hydroxymethylpyrimidine kinase/phosphomethylpyrimidine kinase, partial [Paracoccaceae bacterium]|nr:bifunctional hydroxymethylpyrimidine kinase/phosphomethylpyrimidine kinase [Paracoccaceae bacterium]
GGMIPVVLTVGALDPLGADGLAADLRSFAALGVHGAAAATLVGDPAEALEPARVANQIGAALGGGRVAAVKLGALGSAAVARAVAEALSGLDAPVIADPSLAGREGGAADPAFVATWRAAVLPLATVVTPNLAEAALLTGTPRATMRGEMMAQAEALVGLGCAHAVVSGGHGAGETSTDIIASRDRPAMEMRAERLERGAMRGLSATFASAIAAHAAHGIALFEAVQFAKLFVSNAIGEAEREGADGQPLFPNQMARMWRRAGSEGGVGGGA